MSESGNKSAAMSLATSEGRSSQGKSSSAQRMTTEDVAREIVKTATRRQSNKTGTTSGRGNNNNNNNNNNVQNGRNKKHDKHDMDYVAEEIYIGDTTWGEVCRACFVHSASEWFHIIGLLIAFLGCLYLFGLGLELLSSGAKVLGSCAAGQLFGSSVNPVAGVMVGILATVLLQSSSTTTSIVVGLVGADGSVFSVEQGIYMVMGANIGTTITNTIVSLLQFQNQNQLADAFAGATIHDLFNFLTVAILLPLEVLTGYLFHLTGALVRGANTEDGDTWVGPAKKLISPLAKKIIIANKKVSNAVAGGGSCQDFYPIFCEDPEDPTYSTCETGLITCDKSTDMCPAFFDPNAGMKEDQSAGLVVLFVGLFTIFVSMVLLVQVLTRLLTGVSIRIIHKATTINGYLLILIGTGLTTLLQSSSTTTSFLTPVVGIGALRLDQMYPLTIGANVGTTVSALFSAMATDGNDALQVALAHMMFNITGTMIWYPILPLRRIPLTMARRLGQYARVWRPFTLIYLFGAFFLLPLICLGLSALFIDGRDALTVVGSLLTVFLGLLVVFWIRWCYFCGGRAKFYKYLSKKHERYMTLLTLTTDMEKIKKQLDFHMEYSGIEQTSSKSVGGDTDDLPIRTRGDNKRDLDVESYSRRKEKLEKSIQDSLATVADDMAYLKAGVAILHHHTGVGESSTGGENDDDDSSTRSGEDPEAQNTRASWGELSKDQLQINYLSLWNYIPKIYLLGILVATILMIWGVIALFKHGGKASVGAAYFLISVAAIALIWAYFTLDLVALHDYFKNTNYEMRRETISNLPKDMKKLKGDLRKLLEHYRLYVDDLLGSSTGNATNDL